MKNKLLFVFMIVGMIGCGITNAGEKDVASDVTSSPDSLLAMDSGTTEDTTSFLDVQTTPDVTVVNADVTVSDVSMMTDAMIVMVDSSDAVSPRDVTSEDSGMVCASDQMLCSGVCLMPVDNVNCGACGNTCSGHSCQGDGANIKGCVCGSLPSPTRMIYSCFGVCGIMLGTDNNNCGYCGHVCPNSTTCTNGSCT